MLERGGIPRSLCPHHAGSEMRSMRHVPLEGGRLNWLSYLGSTKLEGKGPPTQVRWRSHLPSDIRLGNKSLDTMTEMVGPESESACSQFRFSSFGRTRT